jgi:hypothetical protein
MGFLFAPSVPNFGQLCQSVGTPIRPFSPQNAEKWQSWQLFFLPANPPTGQPEQEASTHFMRQSGI